MSSVDVHRCDRCNVEIKVNKWQYFNILLGRFEWFTYTSGGYEYCVECYAQFKKFHKRLK